jgi:hypothetical protein
MRAGNLTLPSNQFGIFVWLCFGHSWRSRFGKSSLVPLHRVRQMPVKGGWACVTPTAPKPRCRIGLECVHVAEKLITLWVVRPDRSRRARSCRFRPGASLVILIFVQEHERKSRRRAARRRYFLPLGVGTASPADTPISTLAARWPPQTGLRAHWVIDRAASLAPDLVRQGAPIDHVLVLRWSTGPRGRPPRTACSISPPLRPAHPQPGR